MYIIIRKRGKNISASRKKYQDPDIFFLLQLSRKKYQDPDIFRKCVFLSRKKISGILIFSTWWHVL